MKRFRPISFSFLLIFVSALTAGFLPLSLAGCRTGPDAVPAESGSPAAETAENPDLPEASDPSDPSDSPGAAVFADSTTMFNLRVNREKATEEALAVALCYDGVELPRAGKVYYLPVEEDFPAENLLRLSIRAAGDNQVTGTLYIDSHLERIGILPLLTHNTHTDLYYCTDEVYVSLELCFTTLPVLHADMKRAALTREDRACSFSLWEAKNGTVRRTDSPAAIRIRGASSSSLAKTGFKLSLLDGEGNPNKLPLLGMRRDDDWILYASYSDNAHVRDAVGWHLWQKMAESAGLEPSGALEVRWVELILADKYYGFYLMMEQMDQKTLGLDAAKGDSLFKCISWDVPAAADVARLTNRSEAFSSLERKDPEREEIPADSASAGGWKDMADFVGLCYETSGEEFARQAEAILNKEEILEYWLFLNLSMAADNTWKNTYYAVMDGKVSAYPWDLDITFGLGWNGDFANNYLYEQPGMDTRTYDFQAGRRLIKYVAGCGDYVRSRYETLKAAGICSSDALIADAEEQWAILHNSGAWARNLERWPSVSTTDSLDYFKKTVRTHEAWFEEYLKTLP